MNRSLCPTCNDGLVNVGLVKSPVKAFLCFMCDYTFAPVEEEIAMENISKPIYYYRVNEVSTMNIYKMEQGVEDRLLVGLNDDKPTWVLGEYTEVYPDSGDQLCFDYKRTTYIFDKFKKVSNA